MLALLMTSAGVWIVSHGLLAGSAHRAVSKDTRGQHYNKQHKRKTAQPATSSSSSSSSSSSYSEADDSSESQESLSGEENDGEKQAKREKEVVSPYDATLAPGWWKHRKKYSLEAAGERKPLAKKGVGIVTYIGNDKYVDGGLVVGYSAGLTSGCGEGKWCRTGVLLSKTVAAGNVARFKRSFDDVIFVNRSLSTNTKKTPWGTTFDKLHLWGIVRYQVLIFYDADMILTRSTAEYMDRVSFPSDPYWLGALTGPKGYFATGTMILRPRAFIHAELLTFYNTARHNKTDKWGFRGINGRDGLVMRYFIAGRTVGLPAIPGHHASGSWKPWYNINGDKSEVKNIAAFLKGKPQSNAYVTHF